eukprot:Pgem_evm1s1310
MVWFMLVDNAVCKVVVPKGFQIFYHGLVEHGALLDSVAEVITCTQIIGPKQWELEFTNNENTMLDK